MGILSVLSQKACINRPSRRVWLFKLVLHSGELAAHGWGFEGILVAGMILGSVGAMMMLVCQSRPLFMRLNQLFRILLFDKPFKLD